MDAAILGIDTSTAACSACVLLPDGRDYEITSGPGRLFEQPAHARELLPAVEQALTSAAVGWDQIGAIAVGVGPGAFTGLRIGVATARALASARGVELIPVSSLEAVAFELLEEDRSADYAMPVFDAKRGELFVATYSRDAHRPKKLADRRSIRPAEIGQFVASLPPGQGVAAGDGAVKHHDAIAAVGLAVADTQSRTHMVRGRAICRLARHIPGVLAATVEPDYVREPDIDQNVLAAIAARGQ